MLVFMYKKLKIIIRNLVMVGKQR